MTIAIRFTSGQSVTRKAQRMNDVHPWECFLNAETKTNGCVHQIFRFMSWLSRGWPNSLHWNPPKVTAPTPHVCSCPIYICAWPLYDLIRKPYSPPDRQTDTQFHTETQRDMADCRLRPHHTCPNVDSTDLYQAALVNMPRAMTPANICVCVRMPKRSRRAWDLLPQHRLHTSWDWRRPEVIRLDAEWMTVDKCVMDVSARGGLRKSVCITSSLRLCDILDINTRPTENRGGKTPRPTGKRD